MLTETWKKSKIHLKNKSTNLDKSLSISKSFPKIISSLISFITFVFVLKYLGKETFANLLVCYSLGSIFLWITDFGLLRLYIYEFSLQNYEKAKAIWSVRLITSCSLSLLLIVLLQVFFESTLTPLIIIALLDIFTDSYLETRIINTTNKASILLQLIKRVSILTLIILSITFDFQKSTVVITSIYLFVCTLIVFLDFVSNGTLLLSSFKLRYLLDSGRYWIQNAGTYLSNFDIPLISMLFGSEMVIVISTIRKITAGIAIFGMTTSTLIFSEVAKKPVLEIVKKKIMQTCAYTLLFSILGICFTPLIFGLILQTQLSRSYFEITSVLFILTPIGVLLSIMNSILLALKKFTKVTAATFSSSISYLIGIYLFYEFNLHHYAIIIGLFINYGIELFLYTKYLRNRRD